MSKTGDYFIDRKMQKITIEFKADTDVDGAERISRALQNSTLREVLDTVADSIGCPIWGVVITTSEEETPDDGTKKGG